MPHNLHISSYQCSWHILRFRAISIMHQLRPKIVSRPESEHGNTATSLQDLEFRVDVLRDHVEGLVAGVVRGVSGDVILVLARMKEVVIVCTLTCACEVLVTKIIPNWIYDTIVAHRIFPQC